MDCPSGPLFAGRLIAWAAFASPFDPQCHDTRPHPAPLPLPAPARLRDRPQLQPFRGRAGHRHPHPARRPLAVAAPAGLRTPGLQRAAEDRTVPPSILTTCARKATSRCPGKLPSSPVPDGLFSVPDRYPQLPSALSYAPRRKASRLSRNEPISRQSPFAFHWSPNGNQDQPSLVCPRMETAAPPAPHVRPHPLSPEDRR